MVEFRKSLPAYKEKERLLAAVARNQVHIVWEELIRFVHPVEHVSQVLSVLLFI
jgi:hypothetical protein